VSTPGSVEFNKDVLGLVTDNVLVVLSNNNFNGTIVRLGDRLRLERGLKFSSNKRVEPGLDVGLDNLFSLVIGELGILGNVRETEGGPLGLEVDSLGVGTIFGLRCCSLVMNV
jgi:hypothetical protein